MSAHSRLALLALALWGGLLAWERSARVPRALRAGEPVGGLLCLRFGAQGAPVAPALYWIIHHPARGTVDVVELSSAASLPAPDGGRRTLADVYGSAYAAARDPESAGEAMAAAFAEALAREAPSALREPLFHLHAELQGALPYPEQVRAWLLAGTRDPLFWPRLPWRLKRWLPRERTGLDPLEGARLAWILARTPPSRVRAGRFGGSSSLGLWLRYLGGRDKAGEEPATVEVLNGSGIDGVALGATKILRYAGMDVVHFGNLEAGDAAVRFIDRSGAPERAHAVRRELGCPEDCAVLTEIEAEPRAMVSALLGSRYRRCGRLAALGDSHGIGGNP